MKNSEELAEEYYDEMANHLHCVKDLAKLLRDFATYHVTEALKIVIDRVEIDSDSGSYYSRELQEAIRNRTVWVPANSITNAYPLTNIE
jgi:hypothetical protein